MTPPTCTEQCRREKARIQNALDTTSAKLAALEDEYWRLSQKLSAILETKERKEAPAP